jgi:carboxypeptidase Taq
LAKEVDAKDLKEMWNAKYEEYLGINPTDDLSGILQDIHWSHGSIGYFPTYSLGSFYAAQIYAAAEKDIPKLSSLLSKGKTKQLLEWLRTNIHKHGRTYNAEELCELVTGEPLNTSYFIDYATKKFEDIYDLNKKEKGGKGKKSKKKKSTGKKKKKKNK